MSSSLPEKVTDSKTGQLIDLSNVEFQSAWQLLEQTSRSVFLTGKAGTGKSTFLRYITSQTKKKYVVLAPTGIAAVNVGGQTMHSFFKIPLKPLLPDDPDFAVNRIRQRLKYSAEHIKLIRSLELIIIDEISMVRADIIDFIDRVLRVFSGNMRQPFGGKQLLFVGDIFQLEPVVTGDDRDVLSRSYHNFYFFNANVFKQFDLVPIELEKVYRQADRNFISLLDNVRTGRPSDADIRLLNSRYLHETESDTCDTDNFTMTIATRREMVDSINETHLRELKTPSVIFEGVIDREFPLSALPTDMRLELKIGAQIVFVKNDPERRWVNGSLAVVETVDADQLTVRTEDGNVVDVEPEIWTNVKYVYNEETRKVDEIDLGTFTQYPVKLAWALTIHKSQGLTFNKVIIDLGRGAFSGGQTYVALSRSRSLDGITLSNPVSYRDIFVKPEIVRFAEQFNNRKLIETAINNDRADSLFVAASRAFSRKDYKGAVDLVTEAVSIRPSILENDNVRRLLKCKMNRFVQMENRIKQLEERIAANNGRFMKLADRHVKMADEIVSDGWDTAAALAQYNSALDIMPSYAPAMLGKARLLMKSGDLDEAEAHFREVASSETPEVLDGMLGVGQVRFAAGDSFGAVDWFLKAHLAFPNSIPPLEALIDVYLSIGAKAEAAQYKKELNKLKKRK